MHPGGATDIDGTVYGGVFNSGDIEISGVVHGGITLNPDGTTRIRHGATINGQRY